MKIIRIKKESFEQDLEFYKNNLSKELDKDSVNLMLHAYCMGHCNMAGHIFNHFNTYIDVDVVLETIKNLNPLIRHKFQDEVIE